MTDAAPDLSRKRELNDAAKGLIDDKAFDAAILSLRKRWFEALMATDQMEQMKEYRAMIKALEAIPVELNLLMNDYKKAVHDAARRQPHG
jgi:hypothetical protein